MSDKKLTDSEIVRLLECCGDSVMAEFALDLINRQKAEIERLNKEIKAVTECKFESVSQSAKAEARQEFAERLKQRGDEFKQVRLDGRWAISQYDIDKLLNEMKRL